MTPRSVLAIQELVRSKPDNARVKAFLASGKRFPIVEGGAVRSRSRNGLVRVCVVMGLGWRGRSGAVPPGMGLGAFKRGSHHGGHEGPRRCTETRSRDVGRRGRN